MKKTDKEKVISLLNDMMTFDHNYGKYELCELEYNDFIDEIIKLMQSKVNNVVLDDVKNCETKITTCPHCGEDVYYSNHKHHLHMSCS